jgi:hypothetical protein
MKAHNSCKKLFKEKAGCVWLSRKRRAVNESHTAVIGFFNRCEFSNNMKY